MMMKELLEKLTRRKTEVARTQASEWQTLVIDIADGKETDADATLDELDRLGKTPEDLARAVDLLSQRRTLAATVAAGATAESDHTKITKEIADKVAAFKLLWEAHESGILQLEQAKAAAVFAMTTAADAKRELQRTATDPVALRIVADANAALSDLRREQAEHERELRSKEDRLVWAKLQEDKAGFRGREIVVEPLYDVDHASRLTSEIEAMKSQIPLFNERAEALNAEATQARLALERPEAI